MRPSLPTRCSVHFCRALSAAVSLWCSTALAQFPALPLDTAEPAGPIRLQIAPGGASQASVTAAQPAAPREPAASAPGEFERYVQSLGGDDAVRRLGATLVGTADDPTQPDAGPVVPPDYPVAPGDEVLVTLWGAVEADLRLVVDRSGRILIPRVGPVQVGGVLNRDLEELVTRRVGQVFRNFQASVTLGRLRGIRVFVTGFVGRPGVYTVPGLSTAVSALMRAGGPSAAGSFRQIEVIRGASTVRRIDLYELLVKGDRSSDLVLQAQDIVLVRAVGPQVGVVGSVNRPAVVEVKPGETVADVLQFAGGLSALADRGRLSLERLADRLSGRVTELRLPQDERQQPADGDVFRAYSAVSAALPVNSQRRRVRIEGEVARPAEYLLPPNTSLLDAIKAAGGYTGAAYLEATELTRNSVRITQQQNFDRALQDLESALARQSANVNSPSADAASEQLRLASNQRLLERLRALKPTGRIVLQLPPGARDLPDLALEDGDRIYVPPRPTTVGVFGSVFNAASYLHMEGRTLSDYLRLAGGPTKGADRSSIFVVRANGQVMSNQQGRGAFGLGGTDIAELVALPGDTVFVPEELDKTTFVQAAKDWTQIVYQFGLGIAGLVAATR